MIGLLLFLLQFQVVRDSEVRSLLRIAGKFGIIDTELSKQLCAECSELSAMLYGLIQSRRT